LYSLKLILKSVGEKLVGFFVVRGYVNDTGRSLKTKTSIIDLTQSVLIILITTLPFARPFPAHTQALPS